jgi:hypothetical protein
MLSRFIEFDQADIYGRLIPSQSSFLLLINELPDEESENEFIKRNNLWVHNCDFKYYPENCISKNLELNIIRELKIKLLQIEREQINLLRMSFSEYIQSRATVEWFLYLWGNNRFRNLQAIYREQYLKKIPTTRLRIYPDYVKAEDNLNRLENLISSPILGDSEAWDLARKRREVSKQLAKVMEKRKSNARGRNVCFLYPWNCYYCDKYISIHKGQTCGSEECKKKSDAVRQEKSRATRIPVALKKFSRKPEGTVCSVCGKNPRFFTDDLFCRICEKNGFVS